MIQPVGKKEIEPVYNAELIKHKELTESSYEKMQECLTPMEFELFEKRINKCKIRYMDRYIKYKNIIYTHNCICDSCLNSGISIEFNKIAPLSFEEFVDCCFRHALFQCYTLDRNLKLIYLTLMEFDTYNSDKTKHELKYHYDDSDMVFLNLFWSNKQKQQRKIYDIKIEPIKEWENGEKLTREEVWKQEYPNLFKESYKTVDIEELKKKYGIDETNKQKNNSL